MIHTSFHKGTPLLLIFRDGKRCLDKFVEKRSRGFVVEKLGYLHTKNLRNVSVFKGRDDRKQNSAITPDEQGEK